MIESQDKVNYCSYRTMNNFDSIIFDLDGTLWDTSSACAIGWNTVLKRNKIEFRQILPEDVRRVTGKPHEACVRETFLGLPEKELQILIAETIIEDNLSIERLGGDIYPDVAEGLFELAKSYRLFIVSNCQSGYVETFLKTGGFANLFEDFESWGNTGNPKEKNLAALIERNCLNYPVMVGDTESDLIAARRCGIPFFYVKYGFGVVKSFDREFDSFKDLNLFLNLDMSASLGC